MEWRGREVARVGMVDWANGRPPFPFTAPVAFVDLTGTAAEEEDRADGELRLLGRAAGEGMGGVGAAEPPLGGGEGLCVWRSNVSSLPSMTRRTICDGPVDVRLSSTQTLSSSSPTSIPSSTSPLPATALTVPTGTPPSSSAEGGGGEGREGGGEGGGREGGDGGRAAEVGGEGGPPSLSVDSSPAAEESGLVAAKSSLSGMGLEGRGGGGRSLSERAVPSSYGGQS